MEATRVCKTCQIEKPLADTHYSRVTSNIGNICYHRSCRDCRRVINTENRRRRMLNPEAREAERLKDRARYRAMSPERKAVYLAQASDYHARKMAAGGRPELNAKVRARYHARSEEQKIRDKIVKAAYNGARRRAERSGIKEKLPFTDVLKLYNDAFGICAYCLQPHNGSAAIDHIIPLVQGGTNTIDNLAVACGLCNAMKNRRTPEQWLGANWEERRAQMLTNLQPNNYTFEVVQ